MYAELDCKTNFSFLRGASHPYELVRAAAALGLPALALSDHDGVYGIPKAYWEARKYPGLKLICGASVRLEDNTRLILLPKDRATYGLLCRLLTTAHAGKAKGEALLQWSELQAFLHEPQAAGLFALAPIHANLARLRPLFPQKQLYLSLARVLDGRDPERTEKALWLRQRFQTPLVATNEVHYHERTRQRLQDALTSMRELTPLQKLGHKLFPNGERHLKSPAEMQKLFQDLPEALEATMEIAEQCTFSPAELRYRYPSEWIPENHSAQSYLELLTWEGAHERYPQGIPENVQNQLRTEFALIQKLGYPDYFLTIYDIVAFARREKILCQGRGAAANSSVCYCLGITAVDPTKISLLFERFLSEERHEPPDIDVDFEHERREEVLQYVYEKYGRHRAAMVSAVVTYRSRSALRELAKAFGIEVGSLSAKKLQKNFAEISEGCETPHAAALITELSEEMKGFPRHLSIHSGGFTLSADPITEIVPVEPARMEGRTIIQWDKYDLDYLGLLKVDLLSLGMLSAIRRTLQLVGKDLHTLNPEMNDPATYAMIQRADTVGTFQIESRAQMSMLGRLQPKNFYDLVIEVAIVRPGPIVGGMVHPYLKRRRGLEKVEVPHPKLKPILERTLGVPLFQEQVMKMAVDLGGFSPGEADELRRAIGAWRSIGDISPMKDRLKAGFLKSGLSEDYADKILAQISGFAEYGFPESHAASFAQIAYSSSYLKCHHPAEFTCGLLNSLPMGFYAAHTLVDDAKLHGVKVLPLDPEKSEWESTMRDGALQLGWKVVRGLHKVEALQAIASRPFANLSDFLRRVPLRRDALIRLALGGAFERFGLEPRSALWQVLEHHRRRSSVQGELFLDTGEAQAAFPALGELGTIREQYHAFDLSTQGHPMKALRKMLRLPKLNTQSAKELPSGSHLTISGLILVRQKPPTAKKMTFSTLEDEFGFLDMAIAPDVYERVKDTFLDHCFLEARGRMQRDGNSFSLWVLDLRPLWKEENTELFIEPTQYFH